MSQVEAGCDGPTTGDVLGEQGSSVESEPPCGITSSSVGLEQSNIKISLKEGLHRRTTENLSFPGTTTPASQMRTHGAATDRRPADVYASNRRGKMAAGGTPERATRRGLFLLITLAVVVISFNYSWQQVHKRRTNFKPSSPVAQFLHHHGFHHVGLFVTNISRSVRFYTDVLGGNEIDFSFEPSDAGDLVEFAKVASGKNESFNGTWSMVSFGNTAVMLWEIGSAGQLSTPVQLALRLAEDTDVDKFLDTVRQRVVAEIGLGVVGDCEKFGAFQSGWRVVVCKGPDGESVQFWQPNLKTINALQAARHVFARTAHDGRSRDLFE